MSFIQLSKNYTKIVSILLTIIIMFSNIYVMQVNAADSKIESAIQWAINIANDNSHGYSQHQRYGNPDYDCSSLVAGALNSVGFGVGWFSTASMPNILPNKGFTRHNFTSLSSCQRGDILWRSGHTEIYIGSGKSVGAHMGYKDIYDDKYPGDQTGNEINVANCGSNWTYIYRYGSGGNDPQGSFDGLTSGPGYIQVRGWAFDKDDTSKALSIHVYIGGPAGSGEGYPIIANVSRPDVNTAHGCGNNHGFEAKIPTSKTGNQAVYVYAINIGSGDNTLIDSKTINIPANNAPKGSIDGIEAGYGYIHLTGWAFDPDEKSKNVAVHFYVGGGAGDSKAEGHQVDINGKTIYANTTRNDVNTAYGCGGNHGIDVKIPTSRTGKQTVYAYAINTVSGNNPMIGSKTVNIPKDTTKPVISNVKVSYNSAGYTVSCKATDNWGITRVQFPTWTVKNGQDDLLSGWETSSKASGTKNGDTYTFNVKTSDHKNETGVYNTHIYAYDKGGNVICYELNNINYYKYTVAYNANGGTGAPGNQTKTYGVNLTLSGTKPTRTGYSFAKWNTKADGTGTSYSPGATYSANSSATLYAIWSTNKYTISFNANGGTGAPGNLTKTYGKNITLSNTKPTRTGYSFVKWNTKADGTGTSYLPGTTYSANSNATLYAIWAIKNYTVSYNANGGTGAPGNQAKNHGTNIKLSSTKPTRTGYTFVKWNTKSDGTGTSYSPGATYNTNSNMTLYAIWKPITYTVTYNANGGTGAPANQTKTYGQELRISNTRPTRTGYSFKYWNTKADNTGTRSYMSSSSYTDNSDITLYAIWRINTYDVVYHANGGTGAPFRQTKTYNKDLSLSTTKPTRTGYVFQGWATSATATTANYQPGALYSNNANLDLYAVWKANPQSNKPTIAGDNVNAGKGQSVDVKFVIKNNPGIASMGFDVSYNTSAMTLASVKVGNVFTSSEITEGVINKNPYTVSALCVTGNKTKNGTLVTMTFNVKPNCATGVYDIKISNYEAFNIDEKTVDIGAVNGSVTVSDNLKGDVNSDNVVNRNDLLRLGKYFAGQDVEINKSASDVNNDGVINRNDLLRLGKYFAGWDVKLG